jgi:hypothetical protein
VKDQIWVGTRKGTIVVEKTAGRWRAKLAGHAGQGVNFVARDPHSGTVWAALGHGHWGAKLSRSEDGGKTWADASQVKYPTDARYLSPPMPDESGEEKGETVLKDATLLKLWVLAFSPKRMFVGTIPGGLFVSDDGGASFTLDRALWNHESRGGDLSTGSGAGKKTHWFGRRPPRTAASSPPGSTPSSSTRAIRAASSSRSPPRASSRPPTAARHGAGAIAE